MDAEIKREWVAALRSGEYEQGRHQLRTTRLDDGVDVYCCWGVLCDILQKTGRAEGMTWKQRGTIWSFESSIGIPPAEVFEIVDQWERTGNGYELLATDNDAGTPFDMIAEIIETLP